MCKYTCLNSFLIILYRNVVNDLVDSERTYVKVLRFVIEVRWRSSASISIFILFHISLYFSREVFASFRR